MKRFLCASLVVCTACGPTSPVDAGVSTDAGVAIDAGLPADAGLLGDAGPADAGHGDAGTDAGVTDAGVDGGTSTTCTALTFPERANARVLSESFVNGTPQLDYAAYGRSNGSMIDALQLEFWWGLDNENPVFPRSTLITPTSLRTCATCLTYSERCTGPRTCATVYLATGGRVTVYRADRNASNGAFISMAEGIELTAWDRASDKALADGGCFLLERYGFNARWGDAGTVVDATPWDAGMDPCASDEARAPMRAGCNGGFSSFSADAGTDEPALPCDTDGMGPWGSCVDTTFTCVAPPNTNAGTCQRYCGVEASLFSTSSCPSGFRCVRSDSRRWFPVPLGTFGVCARDCDSTHPCPGSLTCHMSGVCL